MARNAEYWLKRWSDAGLLDTASGERIRTWEAGQHDAQKLSLPVRLLVGLGGLTIAAGILLFVAAHWDTLSPVARLSLLLVTIAGFHVAGGFVTVRFPALATTLHAIGTAALGGGIFLAAQIFHLAEHWPFGLLLWAIGAWVGWWLLRDWPQAVWAALLTPAWLVGEWVKAANDYQYAAPVAMTGLLLLAVAYMASRRPAIGRIGRFTLLPLACFAAYAAVASDWHSWQMSEPVSLLAITIGWIVAFLGPLAVAYEFARDALLEVTLAVLWGAVLILLGQTYDQWSALYYLWLAVGASGLMAWGLRSSEPAWINLGVAGFALTVLAFYFSSIFDKLGRSASLLALGVLLLAGGWALERVRRRLLLRMEDPA